MLTPLLYCFGQLYEIIINHKVTCECFRELFSVIQFANLAVV
jgi:hypothetical protein